MNSLTKRISASCLALLMAASLSVSSVAAIADSTTSSVADSAAEETSAAVMIIDENLRKAICAALGKEYSEGVEITQAEMESLTELDASNCGIKDVTGITAAVNLERLDLSGNPLDDDKRDSTDNSLQPGDIGFASFLFDFSAFTKLKYLDLSSCRLGENNLRGRLGMNFRWDQTPQAVSEIFTILPTLEELDLSDNSLIGQVNFLPAVEKKYLKKLDISGNRFNNVDGFQIAKNCPNLEEIDLSDNYIVWDDCVENFKDVIENGVTVNAADQKNVAEIYAWAVYDFTNSGSGINKYDVTVNYSGSDEIILGNVLGDSATLFFATYGVGQTTKVTVGSDENKVTSVAPDNITASGIQGNTIEITGLAEGENRIPVTVMHRNGDVKEYTIIVNSSKFRPGTSEDSAGIVDLGVQQAICSKLGKSTEAETYIITKEDVASLTGTLTIPAGTTDYSFLQYATGITGLSCPSTENDDISYIENLTSLTTLSFGDSKEPVDLSNLINLRTLSIGETSVPVELPELPKLTNLTIFESKNGEIASIENLSKLSNLSFGGSCGSLPKGLSESSVSSITITGAANTDYVLKDLPSTVKQITVSSNTDITVTLYGFATDKALAVSNSSGPFIIKNPEDFTNFTTYAESGRCSNIPENLGEVSSLTSVSITSMNKDILELNDSFNKMTNLTKLYVNGPIINEMPPEIANMTSLKTLNFQGSNFEVMDVDLSNTKIETLNLMNNSLTQAPDGKLLPSTITEMTLSRAKFSYMDVDYSHMTNLNALYLEDVPLVEFPTKLIQGLPNLMTFYNEGGFYEDIPADAFNNSTNLCMLMAGSYIRLQSAGSDMFSFAPIEGSETAKALETLNNTSIYFQAGMGVAVLIPYYNGMTEIANYSGLRAVNVNGTELSGLPLARTLNAVLPAGTETADITPSGFLSDSVITIGDQTVKSGETVTLDLKEGNNEIKISSANDFENTVTTSKVTDYTLNIYVGEQASVDDLTDGNWYQVGCKVLKAGQLNESMAGSYFDQKAIVRYKNGKYEVRMTSLKSSWMNTYKNKVMVDGKATYIDADVIEEDKVNDICVIRFTADTLEDVMTISMFVTPMGYSPSCDVHFDLSTIINVNDQMPAVDTADLNAAINKAITITEKNNVYTDETWQAFLTALENAQAAAANPIAEDDVTEAADALNNAMENLTIDKSKLADKTALKAAIDEAAALEKGNHTDTAWNALQEAISDAQSVYDTVEARQSEVDSAVKALNTAITLFNASGEASKLDKNNLEDGVYSIHVDMIKLDRETKSMADNAINHTAKLEVKDGKYYVTLDFRGITIENRFGYLKNLSYYLDGYTYNEFGVPKGTLADAAVVSTQKDSDGNDIIDQYNDADNLYPDIVTFELVPSAIADENGYAPLHVFVPIMEAIAEGNGDQDVLMQIDWSTLTKTTSDDPVFQPEDPIVQSPELDYTDPATGVKIHADKGVFDEGVTAVIKQITEGADYDSAKTALADVGTSFNLYDVSFVDADGAEVEPNGKVTVSIPIPDGFTNPAVYRIVDGKKVLMSGTAADGMYTFATKTSGVYAIVNAESVQNGGTSSNSSSGGSSANSASNTSTKSSSGANTANPATGAAGAVSATAALSLAAVVVFKKRKDK